jgi:thiol-disulfide isomerase/thioredoxin
MGGKAGVYRTIVFALIVGLTWFDPKLARSTAEDPPRDRAVISGAVRDESGRPVAGAHVWLRHGPIVQAKFESVHSDSEGAYRFTGVEPGLASLAVVAPGRSFGGQHRYNVQSGETVGKFDLHVSSSTLVSLRILDTQGNPISGANVASIGWKFPEAEWFVIPREVLNLEGISVPPSDDQGLLQIGDLPDGAKCRFLIKHPDYAWCWTADIATAAPEPVPVTMPRGRSLTVDVTSLAGASAGSTRVTVIGGGSSWPEVSQEPVDDAGRLTVRLAPEDFLILRVEHPELTARPPTAMLRWTGDLESGEAVRFELVPRGTVRGRVVDTDGLGLSGVKVSLRIGPDVAAVAVTGAEGRFELQGPAGAARLAVDNARGFEAADQGVAVDVPGRKTVEAPDMAARRLSPLRGVVMRPDGQPEPQALVVLTSLFGRAEGIVLADDQGRFELPVEQKQRDVYHVAASALTERLSGGDTLSADKLDDGIELQIRLQPESTISGVLTGPDGQPYAGVSVTLQALLLHETGMLVYNAANCVTDEAGRYRFPGLSRHLHYRVDAGAARAFTIGNGRPNAEVYRFPPGYPTNYTELTGEQVPLDLRGGASETLNIAPSAELPPVAGELSCSGWINSPPLSLEALRGKVVLLDFWATWCAPCVAELPQIQLAHELYSSKGAVIIGLHHNSVPEADVRRFLEERHLTFPVAMDSAAGETCGQYDVSAWPTRVLIGRDGRILSREVGGNPLAVLRRAALYGDSVD